MGQMIVITSGKGGVGKTTTAAGLGVALALLEQKTVIVDLDFGLRKLDLILGVSDRSAYHLGDVIRGQCSLEEALIPHPHYLNLFVLLAPQGESHQAFFKEQLEILYLELKEQFDFVLIDCPAGADQGFEYAVLKADQAILVVQCEAPSLRDGDKIAELLTERGIKNIQLLINRYQEHLVKEGVFLSIESVIHTVKLPLVGVVHEDIAIIKGQNTGQSVFLAPDAPSALCFKNIARRLLGQEVPLVQFKPKGLLTRLKKAWKET